MALSSGSGWAGTMAVPSCCRARLPTWGPLPCTITARQPASITACTADAIAAAFASISSHVPDCPTRVRALPPSATTAVLVIRILLIDGVGLIRVV